MEKMLITSLDFSQNLLNHPISAHDNANRFYRVHLVYMEIMLKILLSETELNIIFMPPHRKIGIYRFTDVFVSVHLSVPNL